MIAVIDPALFLVNNPAGALLKVEEDMLCAIIDDVARTCRASRAVIPAAEWYWAKLQNDLVRPLHRLLRGPQLPRALDELRSYTRTFALPEVPDSGTVRLRGVKPLFDWNRLDPSWMGVMERLLIGCAQLHDDVILITRLFDGRNLTRHAVAKSTGILSEKTRWRLYVHVPGSPPRAIPCVRNLRNLNVPWTARLDEKLPEGGRFPFCPLPRWWLRDTRAFGTHTSKPAWIDTHGSGWAQPSTGGDYHWDVFITDPNLKERVSSNVDSGGIVTPVAINVVASGTREAGKVPGDLHHEPMDRQVKSGAGWTCPKR